VLPEIQNPNRPLIGFVQIMLFARHCAKFAKLLVEFRVLVLVLANAFSNDIAPQTTLRLNHLQRVSLLGYFTTARNGALR